MCGKCARVLQQFLETSTLSPWTIRVPVDKFVVGEGSRWRLRTSGPPRKQADPQCYKPSTCNDGMSTNTMQTHIINRIWNKAFRNWNISMRKDIRNLIIVRSFPWCLTRNEYLRQALTLLQCFSTAKAQMECCKASPCNECKPAQIKECKNK